MKKYNRALIVLLTTNGLILFAGAMLGPIYAIFVEQIGGDILDAGFAGGVFALVAGVATYISGKYVDGIKENELVLILGYLIIALGFFSYIWVDAVWELFVAQALIGLGEALYSPAFDAIYSKHLDLKNAGREWGAWESMNYFTFAFGASVGGWVAWMVGFTPLFIFMGSLSLVSVIYLYLLPRRVL